MRYLPPSKPDREINMDQMFFRWQPAALSLFRFVMGLVFLHFGIAKLFKFPAVPVFAHVTPFTLIGAAGMIELVFGGLLMLGLLTRLAAFILSGEMAFAYFLEHFPRSFYPALNDGALAIILCFGCLYLATAGGGPASIDAMIGKTT